MSKSRFQKLIRRIADTLQPDPSHFLTLVNGVIHVGANTGQERNLYHQHNLHVLWIEPNPEIYTTLCNNLADFPKQAALKALLAEKDNLDTEFHIANNNGASSSIYPLHLHRKIWPEIKFEHSIALRTQTLPSLLNANTVNIKSYDALILDTQGSELLILKGALSILSHFRYIQVEAPNFEAYRGCCLASDLEAFLTTRGFQPICKKSFASSFGAGTYYTLVFQRSNS